MDETKNKDTKKIIVNEGASTSAQALAAFNATASRATPMNRNVSALATTRNVDEPPEDAICLFCKKQSENRLTAINEKQDILGALTLLTVEYDQIPSLTDYICYQCVYRVNVIIDFRRLLERNIKKSRANYYYNIGDKEKCKKYLLSCTSSNKIDNRIYSAISSSKSEILDSSNNGIGNDIPKFKISNVRSVAATISGYGNGITIGPNHYHNSSSISALDSIMQPDFLFDCFNDMYQMNDDTAFSPILEVLYEDRPQSVLVTESGGGMGSEVLSRPTTSKKASYQCTNCSKTCTQLRFLRKHERQQHSKPTRSKRLRTSTTARVHKCNDCSLEFQSLSLLKDHQKTTHQKILDCSYCPDKFTSWIDWDLHEAICYGKKMANNAENQSGHRYQTRSRKALTNKNVETKVCPNNDECESDDEIEESESVYHARMKNIRDWVGKQTGSNGNDQNDDDNDSVYEIQSSIATSFTRASSLSRISHFDVDESSSDEYLDNSSSILTISSTPHTSVSRLTTKTSSKRLRIRAKNSIRGKPKRRRRSEYSEIEKKPFVALGNPFEFGYPHPISYPKLISRKEPQLFECPEQGCIYKDANLDRLMQHDTECHKPMLLFYCKMCKCNFPRKFYFEQHLMYQSYGWYFCIKCEKKFDYEYQLKEHLLSHKNSINEYKCDICRVAYLTQNQLDEHIMSKKHDKQISIPRIRFERYDYMDIKTNNITNNNHENVITYHSTDKIIRSMDLERSNEAELFKNRNGIVFERLHSGIQNCSIPSKVPP